MVRLPRWRSGCRIASSMRRALLLAVLAAPALVSAQTVPSGTIQFSKDNGNDLVHGPYISADECASATDLIYLSWNTALLSGQSWPASAKYQVYVSNKQHPGTSPSPCTTQPDTGNGTYAGAVGSPVTATAQTQNLVAYNTNLFVSAEANPNLTCSVTADTPIYVCVQASDANSGTIVGYAVANTNPVLTLSTSRPDAPTNVQAVPADDGALRISWTAPASSTSAYDYVLTVTGQTTDTTPHVKSDLVALSYVMSGLTNDVVYDISVVARSRAGNESLTAGTTTGTPVHVANFWDVYHTVYKGREQGGCSGGAAGPLALLGVAALLAALRRRK